MEPYTIASVGPGKLSKRTGTSYMTKTRVLFVMSVIAILSAVHSLSDNVDQRVKLAVRVSDGILSPFLSLGKLG